MTGLKVFSVSVATSCCGCGCCCCCWVASGDSFWSSVSDFGFDLELDLFSCDFAVGKLYLVVILVFFFFCLELVGSVRSRV